jgi:hypothetical protein
VTPAAFVALCTDYFGTWPEDRPGIAAAVAEYLATRRPLYLDCLWPLLRDSRPAHFGAPDMECLKALHGRTLSALESRTARIPRIEDRVDVLSKPAAAAAIRAIIARLRRKMIPDSPRPRRWIHGLAGITGGEHVGKEG